MKATGSSKFASDNKIWNREDDMFIHNLFTISPFHRCFPNKP